MRTGNKKPRPSREILAQILRDALGDDYIAKLSPRDFSDAVQGLEDAKLAYHLGQFKGSQPSPSALRKKLRSISSASKRLLKALEADIEGSHPRRRGGFDVGLRVAPHTHRALVGSSGEWMAIRHAAASVRDLMDRADAAEKNADASVRPGAHDNYDGDAALNDFLTSIMMIWSSLGLKSGVSRNDYTGQVGGPFFRFARHCVSHLGETLTDAALAKRIRRLDRST